ncbi:hypothetical protein KR074_007265 [Drosophila pseudoananassae]|nr:hypothetical protein KR074_007265 [Drosophila pseudoananassae]
MKFLITVALIALAIQLVASTSSSSTESTTTTTTTTTTDSSADTTTTTASSAATETTTKKHRKKLCWRGNDWCGTFIPKGRKCKNGKCRKVVVRVTRRKTA